MFWQSFAKFDNSKSKVAHSTQPRVNSETSLFCFSLVHGIRKIPSNRIVQNYDRKFHSNQDLMEIPKVSWNLFLVLQHFDTS